MTGVPSITVSSDRVNCGDVIFMSPTFLAMTTSCCIEAGKACALSTVPLPTGYSAAPWMAVVPGGNGPATVTSRPLLLASGDEPGTTAGPTADAGSVNTNGFSGFTGDVPPLMMS